MYESEATKQDDSMQIDGEDTSGIRFRPVPYTIETDETEMIAVDYVAKGGGNAAAVDADTDTGLPAQAKEQIDRKGKRRADEPPETKKPANGAIPLQNTLTPEEEDQIASMTTRLNSVRMLQSRLSLLSTYITSLPPSNLSCPDPSAPSIPQPHLPHLRNIQALITRLSLLTPHHHHSDTLTSSSAPTLLSANPPPATQPQRQPDPVTHAQQSQTNDVALSSLLALLGQDVQGLSELGRKFAVVENVRQQKSKKMGGMGGFPGGGLGVAGGVGGGGVGDESMMI